MFQMDDNLTYDNSDSQDGENLDSAIPCEGPWPRDAFRLHVLGHAIIHGDEYAFAQMAKCFPMLSCDNATLWLAYMKTMHAKNERACDYIMDSFRRTDWFGLLRDGACYKIVVRHSLAFFQSPLPHSLIAAGSCEADASPRAS